MANSFEGCRVVLTGCSRGVGLATARQLLQQGAELIGVARDADRLAKVSAELKGLGAFESLCADVTAEETLAAVAAAVEKRWSALDVLINNAAMMHWAKDVTQEDTGLLERTLKVNVVAPHRLTLALLPLLKKGGEARVLNVSSGAGLRSVIEKDIDIPSYRLSKYALNGLTLLYSNTFGAEVAVNSLDPGWLKTDMGGPDAPGLPEDGARRVLEVLEKPFSVTGKFWYGKEQIDF